MKTPNIIVRDATLADIQSFPLTTVHRTIRAQVIEKDGEVVCIAGVTIGRDCIEAFSDMKPVDVPKRTIWRYAVKLKAFIDSLGLPAIAIAKGSDKFLLKLGFIYVGRFHNENVYRLR